MCAGRHSQGGAGPQGCRSPGSAAATVLVIRIQRRKTLPVVKPSRRGRRGTSSRSTWQVLPSAPLVPGTHPDGAPGHVPAAPPPAQATPADGQEARGQLCFSFFFKNRNKNILSRTRLLFHALSRRVTLGRGTGLSGAGGFLPETPSGTVPGARPWPLSGDCAGRGSARSSLLPGEKAQAPLPAAACRLPLETNGEAEAGGRAAPSALSVSWWRTLSSSARPASRRRGPC